MGGAEAVAPGGRILMAEAGFAFGPLTLGKTKVDENTAPGGGVVEKVCGFDVTVKDLVAVDALESSEEGPQVDGDIRRCHLAKVFAEVGMAEVRKDGNNLVGLAEGGD